MKSDINGFNQAAALELGLSNDDLLFLRWFIDYKECGKMERKYLGEDINNMGYWVSFQKIIDDLPILFKAPTPESSKKKIQRIISGNLSKVLIKDIQRTKEQRGTKVFLSVNPEEYSKLMDKWTKMSSTNGQNCPVPPDKNVQSDNTIKDKSIKDIYIDVFNKWNESNAGIKHKDIKPFIPSIKKAIESYKIENVLSAIERLSKAFNDSNYYYKYKWNLENFLKQSNGIKNWLDEGQYYVAYENQSRVKDFKPVEDIPRTYKVEDATPVSVNLDDYAEPLF